jgi:pilus assembly protein CpaB
LPARPEHAVSPRRRAVVLLGLAAVLGALAASDVSRREAALSMRLGPQVGVLIARIALPAGTRLGPSRLAVRQVPARFAPAAAFHAGAQVLGLRTTMAVPAGADLQPEMVGVGSATPAVGPALGHNQRVAQLVASGSAREIAPGAHVDVLVTRDGPSGSSGGATTLAVADVEVLGVAAASSNDPGPHVTVQLAVSVREAVYLAAAQSFARDIRLLPRPAGDSGASGRGLTVGSGLVSLDG